mmetsp:Transcript_55631/g.107320  ORF Transcript_55631/g.107320 Transcript_55631/m.107320 type:complete len:495 (+) Transcript_55631:123-1607(+)
MLASSSGLILCMLVAACSAEGPRNIVCGGCCAVPYNASHDYFPNKVTPDFSKGFSVKYYPSYKVVTIQRTQEQYVLFQRGTPQPEFNFGNLKGAFITVPIERAAVLSNAYFNYFELLGERRSIVVTTKHDYLNEPCLLKMVGEDGMLDGVTNRDLVSNNVFVKNKVNVIFRWSGSRDDELNTHNPAMPPAVRVDTGAETTAAGMMEWIKYVSLFFNREREASRMVTEMKSRYDCIVAYVRPQPRVRVLYSSFSYSSSSSQVRCSFSISAWHKRMIEDVGGEVIGAYPNYLSSGPCNMTAFREQADTADVWLYKSNNFQEGRYGSKWAVKWNISGEVANIKPFLNGRTFDPNGNHFRDFWASRIVQLDVELEDLVVILHPALNYNHQRRWWLDVKTEVDPGQPTPNQCKCKYGAMQLAADACPGNPATAPQGNLKPHSDYGCNGELTASACNAHPMAAMSCTATKADPETSGSHRPEQFVSLASLLLCHVFVAKY